MVSLGSDTVVCKNTAVTLDAGIQNGAYLWSTGAVSQKISVVAPGAYTVSVRNQCGVVSDAIVVENLAPLVVDLGEDRGFCSGERLTLDAGTGGIRYAWSTGDSTAKIQVTKPGTYSVNVSDRCGMVSDQITLYDGAFQVNAGDDVFVCQGGTAVLTATGGNSYLWNTGATTASI